MSQIARQRKHELLMLSQDKHKKQKEIDNKATEVDPKKKRRSNYCKVNFK